MRAGLRASGRSPRVSGGMLASFALLLCTAGDVRLTPDEVEVAPPGILNIHELEQEDSRLSEPPSIVHPVVGLVGGSVVCLAGLSAVLAIVAPWSSTGASGRPGA